MEVVDIGILMCKSIGILFFVQMCLPKSGLELEGDPALINPLLDSIYINIQTYQTRGKSRLTFWDFYSKFLHYNLFVYAKMYGKINCRIDKKGEKSVVKR